MKKIMKLLLALFIFITMSGCQSQKKDYPEFTLKLFYYDTCSACNAFKQNALPQLREEFKESMIVEYYNLDLEEGQTAYLDIIDQLEDFDQEYLYQTPLVVLDQKWAILGYNGASETEELIKEIQRSLNNEPLGDYYTMGRYLFKQGEE